MFIQYAYSNKEVKNYFKDLFYTNLMSHHNMKVTTDKLSCGAVHNFLSEIIKFTLLAPLGMVPQGMCPPLPHLCYATASDLY